MELDTLFLAPADPELAIGTHFLQFFTASAPVDETLKPQIA